MRTLALVPGLLAALVLTPAAAHASGYDSATNTYSVSTGDELEQAVVQAKNSGTAQKPATIDLDYSPASDGGPHQYELTGTLTLSAGQYVTIQSAASEVSPTSPNYDAGFTQQPNLTLANKAPGTVLDLSGSGNTVRSVSVSNAADLSTSSAAPLVHLSDGATLGYRDLASLHDVVPIANIAPGAPNMMPLSITGSGSSALGTSIYNAATGAPAVRITGSTTVSGGTIVGGAPALDIDTSAASGTQRVLLDGVGVYSSNDVVAHVIGGSGTTTVDVRSTQLTGGASSQPATLVDIDGATGTLNVNLTTSTLSEGADNPVVTGVAVHPGGTTSVSMLGVLAADPDALLACSGSGPQVPVTVTDSLWNGTTTTGSACSLATSGRVTGDPTIDSTTNAPTWDSVLVDKVPATAGSTLDYYGRPRASTGPHSPSATTVDIGANEYQYAAPSSVTATATVVNKLGAVSFSAQTIDNDDVTDPDTQVVTPASTVTWTFPDGSTQTGATAQFTFPATGSRSVTVTATDPTGLSKSTVVVAAPDRSEVPIDPGPTPTPTPTPTATPAATPTPTPTATPAPTPVATAVPVATKTPTAAPTALPSPALGVLTKFQLVNSRISTSAKKVSGLGKAASNEAGLLMTLNGPATLTVVARTQKGTKYGTINGARFSVAAPAGVVNLRISSVIGKAKLKAGLYRITLLAVPKVGTAIPSDRQDLSIRVK